MSEKTFASLGRIEAIKALFEGSGYTPFEEPLYYKAKAGECVTTSTRTLLEGIDFDLTYFPLQHLGYKSVVAVTGQLLAVMCHAKNLSVTLGVSAKLDFEHIQKLWSGVLAAAKEFGYSSVSLDLQPSKNGLCISVAACGVCSKLTASRRSKAKSKDLVCVSGALGAAFLGMRVLEKQKENFNKGLLSQEELEHRKMIVAAYLRPELPAGVVGQMEECGICPSFGYLIDKGLADTVLKLSRDSGLGVKVYADKIPFEGGSFDLGKELNVDPVSAAMNGGDDYRILFTIPILELERFRHDFQSFEIIGHLARPEAGTVLVMPDGIELPVRAQGWNEEN